MSNGATSIEGIGIDPPSHSLLDTARLVTSQAGVGLEGTPLSGLGYASGRRWSSGVTFSPNGCGRGCVWARSEDCADRIEGCAANYSSWPTSVDGAGNTIQEPPAEVITLNENGKADICPRCQVTFYPFTIYYPDGCTDDVPDGFDYDASATEALDAFTSFHIERELATGFVTGNPSLWSTDKPVIQTTPGSARHALKGLAAKVASAGGPGSMMVHAPAHMAGDFTESSQAFFTESIGDSGGWISPHGFWFNFGMGLTGRDQIDDHVVGPEVAEPVIFATPRPYIALGPLRNAEESQRHSRAVTVGDVTAQQHGTRVTKEREVLVFFNPCHVFSAIVDGAI